MIPKHESCLPRATGGGCPKITLVRNLDNPELVLHPIPFFLQLPACDTGTICFPGTTLDRVVQGVSAQTWEAKHVICFIFLFLNSISVSRAQFPGVRERNPIKWELCQGPVICLCQTLTRCLSSCPPGTFSWRIFLLPVCQLGTQGSSCFLVPLGSHQRPFLSEPPLEWSPL